MVRSLPPFSDFSRVLVGWSVSKDVSCRLGSTLEFLPEQLSTLIALSFTHLLLSFKWLDRGSGRRHTRVSSSLPVWVMRASKFSRSKRSISRTTRPSRYFRLCHKFSGWLQATGFSFQGLVILSRGSGFLLVHWVAGRLAMFNRFSFGRSATRSNAPSDVVREPKSYVRLGVILENPVKQRCASPGRFSKRSSDCVCFWTSRAQGPGVRTSSCATFDLFILCLNPNPQFCRPFPFPFPLEE